MGISLTSQCLIKKNRLLNDNLLLLKNHEFSGLVLTQSLSYLISWWFLLSKCRGFLGCLMLECSVQPLCLSDSYKPTVFCFAKNNRFVDNLRLCVPFGNGWWLMIDDWRFVPEGDTLKNSTVSDCCITCYATVGEETKGVLCYCLRRKSQSLLCNCKRCVLIIVSHNYLEKLRQLYCFANIFIKLREI